MPLLSVLTPTLNAQKGLTSCLQSLHKQTFSDFELIIADGGSTDATLKIAKSFNAKIVTNHLKTGESGKAVALANAKGKFVLLLDSDNILPDTNWLKKMLKPLLENKDLVGSEPWEFTYRKEAGFIERYSSLLGANDPYGWFSNKTDKINYLNRSWPHPQLVYQDKNDYLILKLSNKQLIPTIGANGTIFKTDFLKKYQKTSYLFDIDIINQALKVKNLYFAKVKTGIIHTYCEESMQKFVKKQTRRITDFYSYRSIRNTSWQTGIQSNNILFTFYSFLIFPAMLTSIKGYLKKPDPAWYFHPIACFLSSVIYVIGFVKNYLGLQQTINRSNWTQ